MQRLPRRPAVWTAALVAGVAGAVLTFSLGLVMTMLLVAPLSFMMGAVFSSLAAGWMANAVDRHRARSQMLPLVGISGLAALMLSPPAVILIAFAETVPETAVGAEVILLGLLGATMIIAGVAATATGRLRTMRSQLRWDAALTLGLLLLAVTMVVATLFIASLFNLAEA